MTSPELETARLILRAPRMDDADAIQQLVSDRAVADTTLRIPHPYPEHGAVEWLQSQREAAEKGEAVNFTIILRDAAQLIGSVGLHAAPAHQHAELGYWIGKPYWGNGYATEAARAMVRYGFDQLGLHRIHAHHFTRNPASGRVLEKIGMRFEGELRQHVIRWDRFEDLRCYGILRSDYDAPSLTPSPFGRGRG